MSPGLLVLLLAAALLAMLPVWRLRVAGWPTRWLVAAWLGYTAAILLSVRFAATMRFLVPILVLAYIAPFIAGPERLTRVLRGRGAGPRPIVNVTPAPPPALPEPRDDGAGTTPGERGAGGSAEPAPRSAGRWWRRRGPRG